MSKIIEFKPRRNPEALINEKQETPSEFLKSIIESEMMNLPAGVIVITWDKDENVLFSHSNITWGQLLWMAEELRLYVLSDDEELDDE